MKRVLTIAGSDSGGGAGIQADLKAIAARGAYGMSAITALTAQNTLGVDGVHPVPASFIRMQIDSVMRDIGADVWKTGMLAGEEVVRTVAQAVDDYEVKNLVVDPVMIAKGGAPLIAEDDRRTVRDYLLPRALLVTPNHHEAQVLTGLEINNVDDAARAARELASFGCRYVLVKGGHLPESERAVDVLFDGSQIRTYDAPRIDTANTHGTGCTYASAIAAEIALGNEVPDAVEWSKYYLSACIRAASDESVGSGHGPLQHFPIQI